MAKNSRFFENLVHDIPLYPGSQTPDGRIVAEIHRGRQENKNFHERSLSIQQTGLERLIEAHKGASMVPINDFRSSETARVLGVMAYEMQNIYSSQQQTAQNLQALGEVTAEGFGQVHDDLRDVKGPNYPHLNLDDLIEKDDDFFATMCAYTKGVLNRNAIGEFHDIFRKKMTPLKNAVLKIETSLEEKIQNEQQRQLLQLQERQQQNPQGQQMAILPPLKTLKDFPELQGALNFFKNPLGLLTDDRGKIYKYMAILLEAAEQYQEPVLKAMVEYNDCFFESYRRAQQTAIPQEMLIKLGQNHLLNPAAQHKVMKYFPETRDDASLTTVNYSLLDIAKDTRTAIHQQNILAGMGAASLKQQNSMLEQGETAIEQRNIMIEQGNIAKTQRDDGLAHLENLICQGETSIQQGNIANYHLASIVANLATIKDGMVDLGEIVEDFADLVEEGFDQVNGAINRIFGAIDERLEVIQMEMVLTRTAVIAELKKIDESILYVGRGIINSIERTNELLAELVEIARDSHKNEAKQYFEDGTGCLKTAENFDDIEEACKRFCKGIEAHGMTAENHYGAALSSELLRKLAEARKRYITTISRCIGKQQELKSQAQEGLGRVEYKLGNFNEAVKQSKDAVDTDPQNHSARYNQAKYLVLQGFMDEAINILSPLIQKKPEWYLKVKADGILRQIPQEYLSKLYKDLASGKEGTFLRAKAQILDDVLMFGEKELAVDIIMDIILINPLKLIEKKIWLHLGFKTIEEQLHERIQKYIDEELSSLTAKICYEFAILLHFLGLNKDVILRVFQNGIEQDPKMYKKSIDRKQLLFEQLALIDGTKAQEMKLIFSRINLPNL